jgi:lipopolysaccharide biosynthesis glycosyltransferase
MAEATNKITVVTVCDNHFSVMLATLIRSIEINHKQPETIEIYIVEDRISAANKEKIIQSAQHPQIITLYWLKMTEVVDQSLLPLDASSFPLNVYVRLFIPHFLPESCSKVIYLDVDMVVLNDISELWNTDMKGCIIAGVPDRAGTIGTSWAGIKNYAELGLPAETVYYNSGLLLFDLVQWRASTFTEQILECIEKNKQYAAFPDQYGLNVVFANRWHQLDSRWNTYAFSTETNPAIIHFIGQKPIYSSYDNNRSYQQVFLSYLALTAYAGFKTKNKYVRLLQKLSHLLQKKIKMLQHNNPS